MKIKHRRIQARRIIAFVVFTGILLSPFSIGNVTALTRAHPSLLINVNLEDDASQWGAFTEVQVPGTSPPTWEINNVPSPALNGRSLRCALAGGVKYSNVHCYRNLPPDPTSNTFLLSMAFYYRPHSTFNNVGGSSIVQALEFTMNKWHQGQRYEWALQWTNVGAGAPKWRYWDPHHLPDRWVDLNITGPSAVFEVEGERWHTINIEGDILAGKVHYRRFIMDGHGYPLDISVDPAIEANIPDKLAVAVQLDGSDFNNSGFLAPYEVFLDSVNFSHQVDGTSIDHVIGNTLRGTYLLSQGESARKSYPGLDSGPVKITSTGGTPILAAERIVYGANGVNTSFTETMGLPNSELDNVYWLPWYNNVELDTQLRFANVSGSYATIHVLVHGQEMVGSPFTLAAGSSIRKSYAGVNAGPVKITSTQNIVAAERLIYKVNNVGVSFSEMMALPEKQLDLVYHLPWYNNVDLDTQLRIANTSSSSATVTVTIGGVAMPPFTLAAGESTRKSYPGVNSGPVRIESTQGIVAAERLLYKANNVNTSFTETMGLPNNQMHTTFWLPWYNNVDLDTQLRIANVTTSPASVRVYIGGIERTGSPFTLGAGASVRKSFAGMNSGPVKIVSNQNIVAAARVIYKVNSVATSFSEMIGLPDPLRDATFWLPWYNNLDLDTQLRFGVP